MASLSRRSKRDTNIWPGFVDALATLLMVVIFLLMIFVLAQFFLGQALTGSNKALDKLNSQVSELAQLLSLERLANTDAQKSVSQLSHELQLSVSMRDDLKTTVQQLQERSTDLENRLDGVNQILSGVNDAQLKDKEAMAKQVEELVNFSNQVAALRALKEELEAKIMKLAAESAEESDANQTEKDLAAQKLLVEKEISESARAQVALLNQQMSALREQLSQISDALDISEKKAEEREVQISSLGKRLNEALASKVHELSRYRSEFFGRLRDVLGQKQGVQIVGDRFVFQSEVLFDKGSADIGPLGEQQLATLATTLLEISKGIPDDLDWVLRIDGHTDNDPITSARFPSNWELSSGRAISVVKFLIGQGVKPNQLVAAGFGEYQPIDNRNDEIAKRRNRRIEFKLTQR